MTGDRGRERLRRDGTQPHPPTRQGRHRCGASAWSKGRPSANHDCRQAALCPAPHGRSVTQHSGLLPRARRHPEQHPLPLPACRRVAQGTWAKAPRPLTAYVAFCTFLRNIMPAREAPLGGRSPATSPAAGDWSGRAAGSAPRSRRRRDRRSPSRGAGCCRTAPRSCGPWR